MFGVLLGNTAHFLILKCVLISLLSGPLLSKWLTISIQFGLGGTVLFWARTPCASKQPSMNKSRESSETVNPPSEQNKTKIKVFKIILIQRIIRRLNPDWQRKSWGWRRLLSYWAMWKRLRIPRDLIYGCLDRCCIPICRWGSAESWLTWPARTNAMFDFWYDLWIILVFKCNIFQVYLKYNCSSFTLAKWNILKYIFSWTSARLPHN